MKYFHLLTCTLSIATLTVFTQDARASGFGGKFQALISSAPASSRQELEAVRELVRTSFRVLGADARLEPLRHKLYRQFTYTLSRHLDSLRVHALQPRGGLHKALRHGLHRAWHLTGRYAKRKLSLAKIPAVFATVRRKTDEGLGMVKELRRGKLTYRPGMFRALFPRVSPRTLAKR